MPTFLQTSFLAGLAALAVPILIHLFFRLKTKRVELGTIRFLRIVLEENARRRKVMRWLLLALRMAFVALLVALFARPYFTAAATSGEKDLMVILIDQSATMQLKGEHGRLFDQAVAEAKQLVQNAGRDARVEVAFFDHIIHPLKQETSDTSDAILLDQLTQAASAPALFGATNYGVAFAWARDVLVNAPPGAKQLHLFTDLQRSGLDWTEVEPLPAEVRAHLHDLGRPVVNNVAVTEVRSPRQWIRPGESSTVRASVWHGGAFALEEVPVVLDVGRVEARGQGLGVRGQGTQKTEVAATDFSKLADRITKRERVKLEPGATVTLDFELPALSEGLWQGRITVEYDDDLAFDNQRYFAVSATPPYRVLVVNGGTSVGSLVSETYFLEAALRLAAPEQSFAESPFAPEVMALSEGATLPTLADFDAVVLANVGRLPKSDAQQLAAFVQSGGGLLVFTGENVTTNSCVTLSEAGLSVGDVGSIKVTDDVPWRLSRWDEKHPIFQPLSDPQHGDLRRLIFAAYTHVVPAADATVLAEFRTGDAAVIERRLGDGTVLWVTTSCGPDWSDWGRSRLFLPIVHQLLGHEVGLTQGGRVRTAEVGAFDRDWVARAESSKDVASEHAVDRSHALRKAPEHATKTPTSASPGVFQFGRYCEVVNVSPRESETEASSRQDFEERFAMKFVEDESLESGSKPQDNVELRQDEVWHWFACVLMGVLLLEGFVGNRTTA